MGAMPEEAPAGVLKLTYDDYVELPNDGKRYEILDGDLFVTPAPTTRHQGVSRNLQRILDRYVVDHDFGTFFSARSM